jgi:hypothetical protein
MYRVGLRLSHRCLNALYGERSYCPFRGQGPEDITAWFGVTPMLVRQRPSSSTSARNLMQVYRDGEMSRAYQEKWILGLLSWESAKLSARMCHRIEGLEGQGCRQSFGGLPSLFGTGY